LTGCTAPARAPQQDGKDLRAELVKRHSQKAATTTVRRG
jgi:hypothetical protein